MAKFEINKSVTYAGTHRQTVEAQKYFQEGEYFVFTASGGTVKVLTIAAKLVHTIDVVNEGQ